MVTNVCQGWKKIDLFFSHFFVHGGWFDDPEYILNNISERFRKIPGTIIQGRYDVVTPMKTAWELHKVSCLIINYGIYAILVGLVEMARS